MKRLLLTTIFADLAGCLATGITLPFYGNFSALPFVLIMTFLNIFIPTFLAVAIYQVAKGVCNLDLKKTLVLHSVIMIAIVIVGITVWSLIDTISSFGFEGATLTNLRARFSDQFLGYLPAALAVALTIPITHEFLTKKLFPKTDKIKLDETV